MLYTIFGQLVTTSDRNKHQVLQHNWQHHCHYQVRSQ